MENTAPNVKGLKMSGTALCGSGTIAQWQTRGYKYITAVLCVAEIKIVSDIIFFDHLKFIGYVCAFTDPRTIDQLSALEHPDTW